MRRFNASRPGRFRIVTLLMAGAFAGVVGADAPLPDPERAFHDRRIEPVRAWLDGLPEAQTESAAALRARAWLARRAGDPESALALIDRAVEQAPDMADLYVDRAAIRSVTLDEGGAMSRMRIARDVRRDLERAVESEPENVDALVGLIAFHRQAPGIVGGRDRRADELMERLQRVSPGHHAMRIAMRNAEQERFEAAASAMSRAIEATERPPLVWRLREATWLRRAGAHAAAHERLLSLLARAPDYRPALFELGLLARDADLEAGLGLDSLRRYLSLPTWPGDPAPALAWQEIGRLAEGRGDTGRARSAYSQALRLDPTLSPSQSALERLGGDAAIESAAD